MNKITITQALEHYDGHKGIYLRSLIDESHVRQLRKFHKELDEEQLSPSSLLKLAVILLGKTTRSGTTESIKIFELLVNQLGGYDALDILNAAKELSEDTIVFLEKYPVEAHALAPVIVSISKTVAIKKVFNITDQLKNPKEIIQVFEALNIMLRKGNSNFTLFVLNFLKLHHLYCDEVIPLLKGTDQLNMIHAILNSIAAKDPSLITLPNLISILNIKSPLHWLMILVDLLPINQKALDIVFRANYSLNLSREILIQFGAEQWDPLPYLESILDEKVSSTLIKNISKLAKLKLSEEIIPLVLKTLFNSPDASSELIKAVETLSNAQLDELIEYAVKVPEYSNNIAIAIVSLHKAQCYNAIARMYVCLHPAHAPGLANFWIQFAKSGSSNLELRGLMVKYPHCASYAADVIEFLLQHHLHLDKYIQDICTAALTSDTLLRLLNMMKEAMILDQTSLDVLLPRLAHIEALYTGATALAQANKFDFFNFDTLLIDPEHAVTLSQHLCEQPTSAETSSHNQSHQHGFFFQESALDKRQSIVKAKDSFSNSQGSEEGVEYDIEQGMFPSFYKL